MRFATPLVPARLIRRYMRFLSDVELDDGTVVKAHCPNSGSMMGLKDDGVRVWI
jgi:sugar fermentation stimulation protein A